ncbi:tetratricopeptide repeat protein [Pseudorhodobacter turbinis]|uniref:Tetratricopeptide repeat protein n=1 Tax=Pseudorhodobacter turbinis TaxID=2500533 RepID=A0A4P8EEM2_9RHOB|nr:tetratricopeptide repeat protein [Pseudorhodobacter turbinis]QCO55511.1 tetratricopeptide repeat protein [Pseudorhodobacter turbinis]
MKRTLEKVTGTLGGKAAPEKKGKLRVALCIAGQMRGYEKAAPSVLKNLIEPLDADVFIHTWSDIGSSINEHRRTLPVPFPEYIPGKIQHKRPQFDAMFPAYSASISESGKVDCNRLETLYNPVAAVIEDSPAPEDFDDFFGFSVPEKLLNAEIKSQWSRQLFYKIWKCNELKKAAELKGGFTYDLVIRLRPDLSIGNPIPESHLNDLEKIHFRIRNIDANFQMSDQYFYGGSPQMDIACDTFRNIPDLWKEYDQGSRHHKYYCAEGLLCTSVKRSGNFEIAPFRTEKASEKNTCLLLSHGQKRFSYLEAKDALLSDIKSISGAQKDRITLALGRTLAAYVVAATAKNKDAGELANLVLEYETETGAPADFANSILSFAKEDLEQAREHAKKALAQEPNSTAILTHLAKVARKQGLPDDAVKFATRAIELPDEYKRQNRPSKWVLFDTLGYAQEDLNNYEEAFTAYMASFSLNPGRAASAYRTGKMLYRLGKYDQSLWFLRQAQILDPDHHAAAYIEAHCLCKVGMYLDAQAITLKFAGTTLEVGGRKTKFLGPLAILQFKRGIKAAAEKTIDAYLATGATHEDEVVELTKLLVSLNRVSDAKTLAKRGLAAHPNSRFVQRGLDWLIN